MSTPARYNPNAVWVGQRRYILPEAMVQGLLRQATPRFIPPGSYADALRAKNHLRNVVAGLLNISPARVPDVIEQLRRNHAR
jgi:hypothetical protein